MPFLFLVHHILRQIHQYNQHYGVLHLCEEELIRCNYEEEGRCAWIRNGEDIVNHPRVKNDIHAFEAIVSITPSLSSE